MDLDEAIAHARERAGCGDACGMEHRQLAEWLEELRRMKHATPIEAFIADQVKKGFRHLSASRAQREGGESWRTDVEDLVLAGKLRHFPQYRCPYCGQGVWGGPNPPGGLRCHDASCGWEANEEHDEILVDHQWHVVDGEWDEHVPDQSVVVAALKDALAAAEAGDLAEALAGASKAIAEIDPTKVW